MTPIRLFTGDKYRETNMLVNDNSTLRMVLLVLALTACHSASPTSDSEDVLNARRLVEQYVAADTAGAGLSDSAESLFVACEGDRAVDFVEPVAAVVIGLGARNHDTVRVVAQYSVLGTAESWDPAQLGHQNWRFKKNVRIRADTFLVVRDSSPQPRIVCGPYHGNHWSVSVMSSRLPFMDDSSRQAWKAAPSEVNGVGAGKE